MKLVSENWTNNDGYFAGRYRFDSGHLVPMYHIKSHLSLIQLVGYAKFINQNSGHIYFRGQTELYRKMLPSLFRNIKAGSVQNRNEAVCKYVEAASSAVTQLGIDTPEYAREPLLQHYGIKTRWLDIVDNLWTALNFMTLKYESKKLDKIYTHVSRHVFHDIPADLKFDTKPEIENIDLDLNKQSYYYLILILSDESKENPDKPGLYEGAKTITIDLRKAAPSIYLRPHCQHALLMRSKILSDISKVDLSSRVNLVIRLDRKSVHDWIGNGILSNISTIYPSIFHDPGYGYLFVQAPHDKGKMEQIGTIEHISN